MRAIFQRFYVRLAALFMVLLVGLGTVIGVICIRSSLRFVDEVEQKLNRNLAADLAHEFQPFLNDSIDAAAIQQKIRYMTGINPRIDIYLLGSTGMIKAAFPGDLKPAQPTVELEPLRAFLAGATLPILGNDPLHAGGRKPFSVAPIEIMGETGCFLYIVLGSERYDSAAGMVGNSYIIDATVKGLALAVTATALVGLLLFFLLTRRLTSMNNVVKAFEQGHHNQRVDARSSDEIGQLGRSFNQMADSLVENVQALRQADQLRRELVANISHDLRSPLTSMQGYLETIQMKQDTLSPSERRQYLDVVMKNTSRLSLLVEQLLELSKLDARQVEPSLEVFSMAELVQDVVVQFRPEAERNGIQLDALLPQQLSPVLADIGMVERVVSNLIDNALRNTPSGGAVRIVLTGDEEHVAVQVVDTGCGIPPEALPHIFERFYTVDKSRARQQGGAGLGLAIAKRILELHGSTLSVQSAVNMGTTFSFRLQAWAPAPANNPALQVV